jgi:putative membrane protein
VLAEPLLTRMALRSVPALRGGVALVTTFIGLLVTVLITDGMDIDGAWTWVAATVIVWLGGLIAALILPAIFLKRAVDDGGGRRDNRGTTYAP